MSINVGGGYEHEMLLTSTTRYPSKKKTLSRQQEIELARTTTLVVVEPGVYHRYTRYQMLKDVEQSGNYVFYSIANVGATIQISVVTYSTSSHTWSTARYDITAVRSVAPPEQAE